MKMFNIFNVLFLCIAVFLGGCDSIEPIAYERVDLSKCEKSVVYFRNCLVARSFNTVNIGVYENDKISFVGEKWTSNIAHQMFNHVLIEAAKTNIKITKLPSFNCFDCFIEQIFYDNDKKEAVMSLTINFAGKVKPFYIVQQVPSGFKTSDLQELFTSLFQNAAVQIVEFVAKNVDK